MAANPCGSGLNGPWSQGDADPGSAELTESFPGTALPIAVRANWPSRRPLCTLHSQAQPSTPTHTGLLPLAIIESFPALWTTVHAGPWTYSRHMFIKQVTCRYTTRLVSSDFHPTQTRARDKIWLEGCLCLHEVLFPACPANVHCIYKLEDRR